MKIIDKIVFRFFRLMMWHKQRQSFMMGMKMPPRKKLEKRKYLTLDGIKNWDELTMRDKISLNIEV